MLLRSVPRNHHQIRGANDAGSGELRIRPWSLRVTPNSDATHKTKNMANAGASVAAGLVPGAWLVNQVIQMPQRGSVA